MTELQRERSFTRSQRMSGSGPYQTAHPRAAPMQRELH